MLRVENLEFSIGEKRILHSVGLEFEPFRLHGIIGPNGSGKSTLLKNICRIWEPQKGSVFIQGKDYRSIDRKELSRLVTLVPQGTEVGFPISVYEIVAMGRNPHLGRFQGLRKRDREIIESALRETQTDGLRDRNVNELSGGECQLAIIARALATEASFILLDEPTSDLDIRHTLMIMDLLSNLKSRGKTVVACIHDLNLARRYCDTISILQEGEVTYRGSPAEAFSEKNMQEVFGVRVEEIGKDSLSFLYFHGSMALPAVVAQ
jgi:iron complex transport system ATP-binding protein